MKKLIFVLIIVCICQLNFAQALKNISLFYIQNISETGAIKIFTDPDQATVYINGKCFGQSPVKIKDLKPGLYAIVAKTSHGQAETTVLVESKKTIIANLKIVNLKLNLFAVLVLTFLCIISVLSVISEKEGIIKV